MNLRKCTAVLLGAALLAPLTAFGQTVGGATSGDVAKIKDEGLNRSQAMNTMRYLTDVIGARLTNSPSQRRANSWTKEQLEKWGIKNAKLDPWGEFGRGWQLNSYSATITAPEFMSFRSYPKAWSPSTNGTVSGDVVYLDAKTEEDLAKFKGKLKGAIVLLSPEMPVKPGFEPIATRVSDEDLKKMEDAKPETGEQAGPRRNRMGGGAPGFSAKRFQFMMEEGVAVLVEPSMGTDSGTIRVMGASLPPQSGGPGGFNMNATRIYSNGAPTTIPQIVAETEQYNRLVRLLSQNIPVKASVNIDGTFYDDDLQGYNTIAEIPGTDLKNEVVMIGGHLDSWHSGTGATDNGAGVTVAMEAIRLIQASGLKPRRTIRIALWTGEEQGLLGSRGYVAKNFAEINMARAMGSSDGAGQPAMVKKPGYDNFSAYYNLDNGTGQIRGIYMQGNEALRPIFKEWLTPFSDFGATTVTYNSTGGTDHQAFDMVGLPGFQFIQDPIEYFGRTWHTTQDVSDRILEDDLKRSAIIMAAFAYNTAMRNDKLPRKQSMMASVKTMIQQANSMAIADEAAFNRSGYNFSVCGHDIKGEEMPTEFPSFLAIDSNHTHAE